MDHYGVIRQEYANEPDTATAFPIPVSLIIVALRYAMKKSWGKKDRTDIKAAVLKLWDEAVVPADMPIVDGALELALERLIRSLLVVLLDAALTNDE
tara:strand:+ start:34744 stop:35034 length:291 start_codon:yes stop_codon:yes gene_type:complete